MSSFSQPHCTKTSFDGRVLAAGNFRSSSIYQAARYTSDFPTTERPRGDKHGPPRGTDVGLSTMTNIMPIPQGARLPQLQLHARDKCSTFTQSETGGPPSLAGRPTTLRVRRHLETLAAIQNERNAASIRDGSTQPCDTRPNLLPKRLWPRALHTQTFGPRLRHPTVASARTSHKRSAIDLHCHKKG